MNEREPSLPRWTSSEEANSVPVCACPSAVQRVPSHLALPSSPMVSMRQEPGRSTVTAVPNA
ncbi:hypothetical protein EAO71_03250 [Streptomyces sp. ms191]|nr:hypothetical protein EAO71_03250 [Streptomyces sp. ms191]